MEGEKYKRLIKGLVDKTDRHELDWKEAAPANAFQVSFANYSIMIMKTENHQGSNLYITRILNSDGDVIDDFSDEELTQTIGDYYYNVMDTLYLKIRRQVLGVDKALDEILNELGGVR
jgi:hypothetical protein